MLTTLALELEDPFIGEDFGQWATAAYLTRDGGDISEPLTVYLASSDEDTVVVPAEIVFAPFETAVMFPLDAVDDTLLDGVQIATITAQADGSDPVLAEILVFDVETITVEFDQLTSSPGDTLTATISVSTTDRVEPFTFLFDSARPDEIASFEVTFDPSENSRVVEIPVTADTFAEGAHSVTIQVGLGIDGYLSDSETLVLTDPGITSSLNPVADGQARDVDMDGSVFESVATNFHEILSQAAAPNGSYGEARGILEFDTSSIPAGAVIQSAVLTLDIGGAQYSPPNDQVMDVFAYAGNGTVESADANQIANPIGQLVVPTDEGWILGSYAIPLDVADIQSLVGSGSHLGIVTKMQALSLSFYSKEFFRTSSRPALHLVYSSPPTLTANSLTLSEGETVTITAANIAATDADTADDAITFSASSVTGGQFLVAGNPATSFTQAQVLAGQVAFAHDGGEAAPAFAITVTDGEVGDGPHATSIDFTSVNDNAPIVPGGQAFSVSETSANGTAVGSVTFSDADLPADSLTVSIAAGNTGGVFGIDNAGQLVIANNANLDYETTPSYTLTIRVFDGVHTTDQTVTVDVLDVPETKFYVVNDGSSDRTYEYGPTGSAVENYSIPSGNSSPRGAATTAAGDRVWVVDHNRKVFVYDNNGGLLGSWTADTLPITAAPKGIATNGTDIWIVDYITDKVYKYTGAASRLSGSQTAASSFNLHGSNSTPEDIVTDGTSIWVVNSASNDKVFKYTMSGSLLGSWTIGSANSAPTGITIDPSNVSDIWIVDSGTDRVYRYAGAASRTSGSQLPASSFALAVGNTNPQGIADPPVSLSEGQVDESVRGSRNDRGNSRPIPAAPGESTPQKKQTKRIAREQVFDSYAADRLATEMLIARTNRQAAAADDQDETESTKSAADVQSADGEPSAIDAALDSAFADLSSRAS